MSASLVGSEMCIRDSLCARSAAPPAPSSELWGHACCLGCKPEERAVSVSYTHLTLPTICSV
eukprot:5703241-Alexandrium_andersonii.AAC.1